MKLLTVILAALMLLPTLGHAQNMIAWPVDEAKKDPSFLTYRNTMLELVKAQDTEAFLKLVDPEIHLSFGGHSGHEDMRRQLNLSPDDLSEEYKSQVTELRDQYWNEIAKVLKVGGRFKDAAFVAPYTWTAKTPEDADAYKTYFVTGSNVLLRSAGNSEAPIITRLSYNIVYSVYSDEWDLDADYLPIRLPDGQAGYLSSQYLRSQIDYRASFLKLDGKWQMVMFIAGD
jgi:hypothetical protein